ncbi:MAG: hypothetical protein HZA08_04285 [Nitrospirae bacterium]|nr:hypothetical protein [Nitrospirota bacterium]
MPISRAGTSNNSNSGYTLIELSIILILLGIMLLFAVPKLGNREDISLRSTARELAGTIQSLFDESILNKTSYQLVFEITENRYLIIEKKQDKESLKPEEPEDVTKSSEQSDVSEVIDVTNRYKKLPEKIFIKDITTETINKAVEGRVTLEFFPDGFMDKGIIHISNGKKDYTLTTTPLTGKVKVLEGYVDTYED